MFATHVFRAGEGRFTAGHDDANRDDDDNYDDDTVTVRRLPSIEPTPGARPERHSSRPPRRPVPAEGREAHEAHEVPVPARRSAHALILMALEVVDRKRAPQNMRGAFPDHLVEMLRSLSRTGVPGRDLGPARIHRLHMHPAGIGVAESGGHSGGGTVGGGTVEGSTVEGSTVDYEVCATYARGPRLFAVAARIQVSPAGASCTALRLV